MPITEAEVIVLVKDELSKCQANEKKEYQSLENKITSVYERMWWLSASFVGMIIIGMLNVIIFLATRAFPMAEAVVKK